MFFHSSPGGGGLVSARVLAWLPGTWPTIALSPVCSVFGAFAMPACWQVQRPSESLLVTPAQALPERWAIELLPQQSSCPSSAPWSGLLAKAGVSSALRRTSLQGPGRPWTFSPFLCSSSPTFLAHQEVSGERIQLWASDILLRLYFRK